jgi:hypothetical protein
MAQIVDRPLNLGATVGASLGNLLQELAAGKASQIASQRQLGVVSQGLESLGIPPQDAMRIAALPEKLQELVVRNHLAAAESRGLDEALNALTGAPSLVARPGAQEMYQQAAPQQNPQLAALQNLISSGQPITPAQFGEQLSARALTQPQEVSQAMPGIGKTSVVPTGISPESKAQRQQSFAETLRASRLSPEHKLKIAAMQQAQTLQKEKLSAKEQELVDKETKPFYDQISREAKGAKDNNQRLARMESLINEGRLNNAAFVGFLDNLGGVGASIGSLIGLLSGGGLLGAGVGGTLGKAVGAGLEGAGNVFLTPQSQEFNKLSKDFLKTARDYFGGRITENQVDTFLETVPTLSQTDEGKRAVIRNLRLFNDAALLRKKIMDQVIKENGGKRPANLDALIEERGAPQLDKIANKFKKGVS